MQAPSWTCREVGRQDVEIHGGKAKHDKIDSKKIAVLLRSGAFPYAYVYPRQMRSTRDLLRRRLQTIRGVGKILGLALLYETGDIARFPSGQLRSTRGHSIPHDVLLVELSLLDHPDLRASRLLQIGSVVVERHGP